MGVLDLLSGLVELLRDSLGFDWCDCLGAFTNWASFLFALLIGFV